MFTDLETPNFMDSQFINNLTDKTLKSLLTSRAFKNKTKALMNIFDSLLKLSNFQRRHQSLELFEETQKEYQTIRIAGAPIFNVKMDDIDKDILSWKDLQLRHHDTERKIALAADTFLKETRNIRKILSIRMEQCQRELDDDEKQLSSFIFASDNALASVNYFIRFYKKLLHHTDIRHFSGISQYGGMAISKLRIFYGVLQQRHPMAGLIAAAIKDHLAEFATANWIDELACFDADHQRLWVEQIDSGEASLEEAEFQSFLEESYRNPRRQPTREMRNDIFWRLLHQHGKVIDKLQRFSVKMAELSPRLKKLAGRNTGG